jgi:hypothetical protein
MSNPFDGIISSEFKALFKNMISANLDGLSLPCLVTYAGTKWTTCPNCLPDNIGGKSSNTYKPGGPIPFYHGVCPHCHGEYKIKVEATDTIYLVPIWDSKQWILSNPSLKVANIAVQTMSSVSTFDNLKRASKIRINTNLDGYGTPDFVKLGDAEPLGLGEDAFILCSWSRA